MAYDYPGNVRELLYLLGRAAVLEEDAFTTDVIAHCDEMVAKVNAIEKNNKCKGKKRRSRK